MNVNQYVSEYVEDKKALYDIILLFLDSSKDGGGYIEQISDMIQNLQFDEEKSEFEHFLKFIINLSNNHHRGEDFHIKIQQILELCLEMIKHTFTNSEIYNFFKKSKKIIHFLFHTNALEIDETIYQYIRERNDLCLFFYPEIKEFIGEENMKKIEQELSIENSNILENFEENRLKGENEAYICSLIRQDSIEEFVAYVTKTNIHLSSEINQSIFETNSFLIKHNTSLIEYAAFFGSIQIFKYLEINRVKLEPSLWLYTIHGRNAELIHILEANGVPTPKGGYEKCFSESIKCHHNEFASYFENNFIVNENDESNNKIISCIFHYESYSNFPLILTERYEKYSFVYACIYNYLNLVELLLSAKEEYIKDIIINTKVFFNKIYILNFIKFLIKLFNSIS